jgi:gluconolactonase
MRIRSFGSGLGFTEGPTITRDGLVTVVSIDQGRLYRLTGDGPVVLAEPQGGPNGATSDLDDSIYFAQNGGNWMHNPNPDVKIPGMSGGVQKVAAGEVSWISREPLAPNDICFGPDGLLYITDPTRDGKFDDGRIWRVDPTTGETELLARFNYFTNGIGFGPDDALWVASTGDQKMLRYAVTAAGLQGGEAVFQLEVGYPDGFAFDVDGNLVIGGLTRDGTPACVQVWTSEGRNLDRVKLGDSRLYTNVALSGDARLVCSDSGGGQVLCVDGWPAAGLALYPLRSRDRLASALATDLAVFDAGPVGPTETA